MKPLLSIYVTTYNHEAYIAQCLDGIVSQQTDFPFEAIVIDDCSTDRTPEIVADYARRFPDIIKPVYNEYNWHSRRKSKIYPIFVAKAQGEFFAVCDGDDYWIEPSKLQHQVDFLLTHPGYSGCGHKHIILPVGQQPPGADIMHDINVNIFDLVYSYILQTSTLVARISVMRTDPILYKLVETMQIPYSDTVVFASLLNRGKIRLFAKEWSCYRQHPESITHLDGIQKVFEIRNLKIGLILQNYPKLSKFQQIFDAANLLNSSSNSLRNGNITKAIWQKLKALVISPAYVLSAYKQRYF